MKRRWRWGLRVAGFLLVLWTADVASRSLRFAFWTPFENDPGLNVYVYQRERLGADVLLLGTSKIKAAVIPAVLERQLAADTGHHYSVFSLGQPGSSTFTSWLVLRQVIASNGCPRLVVLELSPATLNAHHGNIPRALRYSAALPDLVRSARWVTSWDRFLGAAGGTFRGVTSGMLFATRGLYWNRVQPALTAATRKRGAQYALRSRRQQLRRLSDLDDDELQQHLNDAAGWGRSQYLDRFAIGGAPEWAFRSIRRLAAERGVRLVIVDPPVAVRYQRQIYPGDEQQRFREYLDRAAAVGELVVADRDAASLGFTDADFVNLTHLHPDGAVRYSRWLSRDVLAPLLAPPASESDGRAPG